MLNYKIVLGCMLMGITVYFGLGIAGAGENDLANLFVWLGNPLTTAEMFGKAAFGVMASATVFLLVLGSDELPVC